MENNLVKENLDLIFDNLEKFLKTETLIGKPIVVGEVTLIPIISVTFGGGTGGGNDYNSKEMDGIGSGGGMGARISPDAILVIKKDEVTMLKVKEESNLDSLLNMLPDIVSKINVKKDMERNHKDEV
ncbi:Sporulation protein YtfJ [Clostridium sp. DL-VIII]|uniref:GerW family sporulation protein n=1 Tax=Clostridium sp. DL-VIII TaxID=641107 RepID=UPI00023B048C|nr:spore germination protein GerW family protein [Clostridium sp. DL-VIII]EHJ01380.1 Sporulation protein YtfJ [Clostridium sp. DL-VIII]